MGHWSAYEQALVQRGDVTLWLSADATDAWRPAPSGRPGAPKTFSDGAIETALTLRLVFRVLLRQAEGFLRSVLSLMGVDLAAPDHTTLSRRSQSLAVAFRRIPSRGPIHLIVDSTGRSIVGAGEWAPVQHGGRGHRGWKTRHRAVDRGGVIVAHALTEPTVDDATMGIDLIETVDDEIARVTADAAYETVAFYAAAEMRDATVVVPPSKTARVSRRRPRSRARDRTITDVRTLGRRRWKQEAGYPLQARVENAFFRYKSILGDRLRARSRGGRVAESVVACNVLNQMTELGRPESYSKPVFVQAFVAEAPVEGLDVGVLVRLAGFNETQGQPLRVRPCEHRAPAELLPSPGRRRPPGWAPRSGAWPGGPGRAGTVAGRLGHRDREGEARAEADAAALGPDAPALGLDQALADGESQPAAEAARPVPGGGVLAEQLAELVRRDVPALVGDRDRHIQPLALRRDPAKTDLRGAGSDDYSRGGIAGSRPHAGGGAAAVVTLETGAVPEEAVVADAAARVPGVAQTLLGSASVGAGLLLRECRRGGRKNDPGIYRAPAVRRGRRRFQSDRADRALSRRGSRAASRRLEPQPDFQSVRKSTGFSR